MYSCDEPRYTVASAPHFLFSTDSLKESISATKRCLSMYGRCEYHDNHTGESWACRAPEVK